MAGWNEVRRLQAQLESIQSAVTAHRLSDRNCIEIVNKLVELKLLSVVYTLDGKEYITPDHLEREISNELDAHRGRVNVVDLQQTLNVDLTHVQKAVNNLVRSDPSLEVIQGEVIASSYIECLCAEINEILLQHGHVSLAELSTTFGLPLDYVTKRVEAAIGERIQGQLDKEGSGLLYTEVYISRHRARIRGLFSAITRPTPIGPILAQGNFHGKLFNSVLHELTSSGQLAGTLHGRSEKAIYIPHIYTHNQNQWVDSFLTSNGYLEYDALLRQGIDDPKNYIKLRYKNEEGLILLDSCCIGPSVISEIEGCLEELKQTNKWIDIMSLLPLPCSAADGHLLLQTRFSDSETLMILGTIVTHKTFLNDCLELFKPKLTEKAQKIALSSDVFMKHTSQEGEAMGGASGGKKSKKGKGKKRDKDEPKGFDIVFMPKVEIANLLCDKVNDMTEEFASTLANELFNTLQDMFYKEAREIMEAKAQGEAGAKRKKHLELQDQLQNLYNNVRLFEKGLESIQGDLKTQLTKYLLHTLCTDMINAVIEYVAPDYSIAVPTTAKELNKTRAKIINKLPDPLKQQTTSVTASLTGKEVRPFLEAIDVLCDNEVCGIMLRPLDKKREKQALSVHQQSLLDSLKDEQDPALSLHMTTVLLWQHHMGYPLHTPGRYIPQIITHLRDHMGVEEYGRLVKYQELVMLQLSQLMRRKDGQPTDETDVTLKSPDVTTEGPDVSKEGLDVTKEDPNVATGDSAEDSGDPESKLPVGDSEGLATSVEGLITDGNTNIQDMILDAIEDDGSHIGGVASEEKGVANDIDLQLTLLLPDLKQLVIFKSRRKPSSKRED